MWYCFATDICCDDLYYDLCRSYCDFQRDDLTLVPPVYSEDFSVQQRATALPSLLVYSRTDPVLLVWRIPS